ncbi:hypothetical protein [Streptomyces sp. NPDC087270]|uniref:hypothetical protein n=1 Tax=Streptomyces sp. NPDC087270 TaxID=3365774 RepID=UPI00382FDD64
MRLRGLEEHFVTTDVVEAWKRRDPRLAEPMMKWAVASDITSALPDLDSERIAAIDDAGIDVSVLSLTTPGPQNLDTAEAVAVRTPTNDAIAASAPSAAAAEPRRAVTEPGLNGTLVNANSDGRALDAPEFWDVHEAAEDLREPVYAHPNVPLPAVTKAYFRGFRRAGGRHGGHLRVRPALRHRADRAPDDHRRRLRPVPRAATRPGAPGRGRAARQRGGSALMRQLARHLPGTE